MALRISVPSRLLFLHLYSPFLLCFFWAAASLRAEGNEIRIGPHDPWTRSDILLPEEFLAQKGSGSSSYLVCHVGFRFLYMAGHIPGAIYVGAGKDSDGIEALRNAVSALPRDRRILLYCGCCPLDVCPNLRPAFQTVRKLGFANAKILYLPHDFAEDWIRKGYPTEKGR
ncbi:rhodanese-like domain-containing protein [Methylacidimicrobium sp. AP8]|uniref:rhodanese-like domain-containing protein n=1 Tax=Methylacidimicrobium sp. AP8 TaxID=2730359 RepID=UPI001920E5CD|nr:rhodanese-like domain-containing protein [Methylacidimicrobium sp. AP8]